MLSLVFAVIFFCLCLFAAMKDTVTFTIPNWLNLSILVLFIPAAFASSLGWQVAGWHILAGTLALIVSFGLFAVRSIGGGDAKMIPGVVLWVGPAGVLHFIFGMALVGGILSAIVLVFRQFYPAEVAPNFAKMILKQENGIPYGVAIAAGGLIAAQKSPLLLDFANLLNGVH